MMTEIDKRLYDALMGESDRAAECWYLSFATESKWNGGVFVMARGLASAVLCTNILGINPGGEVLGVEVPPDKVPEEKYWCKLITTREELAIAVNDEIKSLKEYEEEEREGHD